MTRKENWNFFSISFEKYAFDVEFRAALLILKTILIYDYENISSHSRKLKYLDSGICYLMQFSKCCERNWRIKKVSDDIVICIVCEEILLYKSFILFKKIKAEEIDLWILRIETMIWFYIIWWPQQHWKLYTLGQN